MHSHGKNSNTCKISSGSFDSVTSNAVECHSFVFLYRCYYSFFPSRMYNLSMSSYYMTEDGEDSPFICSAPRENGMLRCHDVPPFSEGRAECSLAAPHQSSALIGSAPVVGGASVNGCVNWNQYYNVCRQGNHNPHKGAVSFDNIGYAWIAIFQVSRGQNGEAKIWGS